MLAGVIPLPLPRPPPIVYGFKRLEAKFRGQMGLCNPPGTSLMCFRACELSGSAMHARRTPSRNTPYRDAIRGEFRRQTSRGHNEDLITLEARYAYERVPGEVCVIFWARRRAPIRRRSSSRVDAARERRRHKLDRVSQSKLRERISRNFHAARCNGSAKTKVERRQRLV